MCCEGLFYLFGGGSGEGNLSNSFIPMAYICIKTWKCFFSYSQIKRKFTASYAFAYRDMPLVGHRDIVSKMSVVNLYFV